MIGAFHQPRAVLIDTDCLRTLPDREFAAGLAEVIKYGAIRDRAFFDWLEAKMPRLARARRRRAGPCGRRESCRIKAQIVAADEREAGERALLNFGHTFGHAIEAGIGYGNGCMAKRSRRAWCWRRGCRSVSVRSTRRCRRVCALLRRAGLPVDAPPLGVSRYLDFMRRDKKADTGKIRFVLLDRLGSARLRSDVPEAALEAVLT